MLGGEWKVESGELRVESGKLKVESFFVLTGFRAIVLSRGTGEWCWVLGDG